MKERGLEVSNIVKAGSTAALPVQTTEDIIKQYLASLDVKPRSKETYEKAVRYFLNWLTFKGINRPTREDLLSYKQELLNKYSSCTVSNYISGIKSFYRYLEAEQISPNIAAGVKGSKQTRGFHKDALTVGQAKRVLEDASRATLEGLRDYAIVNLLLHTGLRTIEVARANVEDIRSEAGEALLYIQGKGRDSKDAFVILTEASLRPIKEYLKARGKAKEDAPLFASNSNRNRGGRLTTRMISKIAKDALIKAGLNDSRLTAHSFRHTAITLSLLGGATVQEAQALARHSNINTTLIYAHNIDRISKAPERKIDSLLSGY